jgi:hypothetical protein
LPAVIETTPRGANLAIRRTVLETELAHRHLADQSKRLAGESKRRYRV